DRWVIAKGRGEDAGADHGPPRAGPERAEPDERRWRVPVGMLPRLEMVADKDRVEPDLLGEAREIEQLRRGELLGRGLVSKFQHLSLLHLGTSFPRKRESRATDPSLALDARLRGHDDIRDCSLKPWPAHPRGSA